MWHRGYFIINEIKSNIAFPKKRFRLSNFNHRRLFLNEEAFFYSKFVKNFFVTTFEIPPNLEKVYETFLLAEHFQGYYRNFLRDVIPAQASIR